VESGAKLHSNFTEMVDSGNAVSPSFHESHAMAQRILLRGLQVVLPPQPSAKDTDKDSTH